MVSTFLHKLKIKLTILQLNHKFWEEIIKFCTYYILYIYLNYALI